MGDNRNLELINIVSAIEGKIMCDSVFYTAIFFMPVMFFVVFGSFFILICFVSLIMLPYLALGILGYSSVKQKNKAMLTIYIVLLIIIAVLNGILTILSIISLVYSSIWYSKIDCSKNNDDTCPLGRAFSVGLILLNSLTIVISPALIVKIIFSVKNSRLYKKMLFSSPINTNLLY
ncbi:unnamed protein product [Blepharisma stoltei]|uniref:Uncharacterized protein n=1 Tax=Blepharisma stoltei TaxID=1481888 RepID=A0AAU9IKC5_9CILI|nr:unnamed protein product [Blepharisma stoltei]